MSRARRGACVTICAALLAAQSWAAAAHAQSAVRQEQIPDALWSAMQGSSWRAGLGCPDRADLVLLHVPYRDFAGAVREGRLIVARAVAGPIGRVFAQLAASGFRIARMDLVDAFDGDDDRSMAANNTSAFNCRTVEGTTTLSAHARGRAVDINPVQNPDVRGTDIAPPAGRAYDTPEKRRAAQARGEPGLILLGDATTRAFAAIGWRWGGTWRSEKDYQHFDAGR